MTEQTMAERFERLRDLMRAHAEANRMAGMVQSDIDAVRAEIRAAMEADGAWALRDKETGLSARIEARSAWKITDMDALSTAIEESATLADELYEQQINVKRVIDLAKSGSVLPGVEQITNATFVVRGGA